MARSTLTRRSTSEPSASVKDGKLKAIAMLPLKQAVVVPHEGSLRELEVSEVIYLSVGLHVSVPLTAFGSVLV
jgi:hypothetical protein